jgi:hypothetical protein
MAGRVVFCWNCDGGLGPAPVGTSRNTSLSGPPCSSTPFVSDVKGWKGDGGRAGLTIHPVSLTLQPARCPSPVLVYAVVSEMLSPSTQLGEVVETFVRREDAERFVEEVRGDDPDLSSYLRIEERELERYLTEGPRRIRRTTRNRAQR